MSRTPVAATAGIAFIMAYMVAAISLPEMLGRMHWAIEAVYWCIAGSVWVFPIRWLMLWSAHKR